ncbi:hypothetical protein PVAND_008527 [Polypedilum vanderplanki]|uniref:C2H2-type domain-containing protein n=1 Tax=Polypedilum vanderplanki TaxID=319348 RepID=A0A9J6CA89_POLVA|nr:hypothetical protein PVAND_008527 [Polypedilum vanderplanki]
MHHLEHDGVQTALTTNKILKKLGRKQLPGHLIEPRAWTVESLNTTVCHWCNTKLRNRHALHEHERQHCPNNPDRRDKAVCEECGAVIGARDMPRHMFTHGDSHMVNCDICGTRMRADNMPRHLRTHEKVTCEVCGKILSVRHLPTHMKLHNDGPSQKQCPVCDKMISQSFFNKHLKTQHSDEATNKPCPVCGRMLAQNSYNKHLRTQHPNYKKSGVAKGRVEKASTSKASSSSSSSKK